MATEEAPFPVEREVMAVLEALWSAGHAAYLVGGGVRDRLLGWPTADWDIATDALPERILEIFPEGRYENRFGTVLLRDLEITTFRRDHRYADHRRPERVTFSDDIYEDLARRDLTINAIAWGRRGPGSEARTLDPADGLSDLEARLVRAVGDPGLRFDEDALRLLRAVRIAARLDFSIEAVTSAAMRSHASDLGWVSAERLGSEIRRMLWADTPSRAFRLMRETGILAVVLPELDELAGQTHGRTGRSRLEHALESLDAITARAPGRERVALAALLHEVGTRLASGVLRRLRVSGRDAQATEALIAHLTTEVTGEWSDADVRRYMHKVGRDQLDDLLLLREAHARASGDAGLAAVEERLRDRFETQRAAAVPLTLADLAIDGRDLQALPGLFEGPVVGALLAHLLDDVLADPALNDRSTLLARATDLLPRLAGPGGRASEQRAIR